MFDSRKIVPFLIEIILPKKCLSCGRFGKYICPKCFDKIFEPEARSLPSLNIVISAGAYANPILKRILRQFKFRRSQALKDDLADLMLKAAGSNLTAGSQILAIPMTAKRKRERGFNQAELLAKTLAQKTNLPLADGLVKIKKTKPQAEIKIRKERLENVKNAFGLKPGFKPAETVILIDDISTTGATLSEAARVLKKAGTKKVIGLVVAGG
ncbi:MAG: ComF family protein [Patescibacteria group bacterium]